jgi:Zn finger protein HypA/HybF involved in hydrogenase expression
MHELALTEGIIEIVREQAEKNGFSRVLEISLKVGEYSGVIPECLQEFFPMPLLRKRLLLLLCVPVLELLHPL